MACSHVGHDSELADDVVLANNVMLAGHVTVGSFTFVGGGAGVHQFVRIGEGVMVGGLTRLTKDVAPFIMVVERDEVPGFNGVGLKRRGFSRTTISELKDCYRSVFAGGDPRKAAVTRLAAGVASAEAGRFLEFFAAGKRGFVRPAPGGSPAERDDDR
jgi:UDP-N-acetylglucosamine acyltransferase